MRNPIASLVTDQNYMWWTTAPVILGMFIVIMDASIINVALPHMMSDFGSSLEAIEWVSTGYMLATAVTMPTTGFLGDRFGRKRVYWIATALFTIASVLCGLAWNVGSLITFRIFQGLVGGAIQPVSQAIIFEAFPPAKRGMSMAIVGIGAMFAPMIGPSLGGYLVDVINWRWIFYINLPFGCLAVVLTLLVIRESQTRKLPFDLWGLVLMATALTTTLFAVAHGNQEGFTHPRIVTCFSIGITSFVVFIAFELRRTHPLLDLHLFTVRTYSAGTIASIVMGIGLFGGLFLFPLFLQQHMHCDAIQTGLMMIPQGVAVAIMMPITARLMTRRDPRILMMSGMALIGLSLWLQSGMTPDTDLGSVAIWTVLRGIGMGLSFPALNQTTLASVPLSSVGMASGMFNVTRQIGGSFSISLLTALIATRSAYHQNILVQDASHNTLLQPFSQHLQGHLLAGGITPLAAPVTTQASLSTEIGRVASVLAFQDAFHAISLVLFLGIIPCLLITRDTKTNSTQTASQPLAE